MTRLVVTVEYQFVKGNSSLYPTVQTIRGSTPLHACATLPPAGADVGVWTAAEKLIFKHAPTQKHFFLKNKVKHT